MQDAAPESEPAALRSFYQYWPLDEEKRRNWFEHLLRKREVFFRSRHQLNDPNELRPRIVLEGSDAQLRKYARHLLANYSQTRFSPAKRHQEESRLIQRYRRDPQLLEDQLHELLDKIGILSLSASDCVPQMWSYYANGHRGLCVEFRADSGLFLAAQRVTYSSSAPVINRLTDDNEAILTKSMFHKAAATWAHEQEWRVIARWRDEEQIARYLSQHNPSAPLREFMLAQNGSAYYRIPDNAISAVILGHSISVADTTWIRSLIDQTNPTIQLKRAILSPDGTVAIGDGS
jgi:hypothetical protein